MTVPQITMIEEGPVFSELIQGFWRLDTWNYTPAEIVRFVEECLELGITTFDHADIYGSYTCESLFGDALAGSSIKREQYQLITKCGIKLVSPNRPENKVHSYDTSYDHIIQSVENSLRNLHTDYIDLLLIHRPDPLMDADEVAEAFEELKESGKVLHFGVSNFLPLQYDLLSSRLSYPLVTNQIEYSVMNMEHQDHGTLDLCQELDIHPMAWSPFGGGSLFSSQSPQAGKVRKVLHEVGVELGDKPMDQVALAFILSHPAGFLPVLGSGKIERVQSAVEALAVTLTKDQWFSIWEASKGHEVP